MEHLFLPVSVFFGTLSSHSRTVIGRRASIQLEPREDHSRICFISRWEMVTFRYISIANIEVFIYLHCDPRGNVHNSLFSYRINLSRKMKLGLSLINIIPQPSIPRREPRTQVNHYSSTYPFARHPSVYVAGYDPYPCWKVFPARVRE